MEMEGSARESDVSTLHSLEYDDPVLRDMLATFYRAFLVTFALTTIVINDGGVMIPSPAHVSSCDIISVCAAGYPRCGAHDKPTRLLHASTVVSSEPR